MATPPPPSDSGAGALPSLHLLAPLPPLLLAVETSEKEGAPFFADAAALGWTVRQLGKGTPWVPDLGIVNRMRIYHAALRALVAEEGGGRRLVVLSDARDVAVLRGPHGFTEAFAVMIGLHNGAATERDGVLPIVACGEMFAEAELRYMPSRRDHSGTPRPYWQAVDVAPYWSAVLGAAAAATSSGATLQPTVAALLERGGGARHPLRRFPNGGLLAGRAQDVLRFYDWMMRGGRDEDTDDEEAVEGDPRVLKDDQFALGSYMCAHPRRVVLDWPAALLHTCGAGVYGGTETAAQVGDLSVLELWGRCSFFLHVAGHAIPGQKQLWDLVCASRPLALQTALRAAYPTYALPWPAYLTWACAHATIYGPQEGATWTPAATFAPLQ